MRSFDDYLKIVIDTQSKMRANGGSDPWREGQTFFNVLWDWRPDLSEQIRSTELDPFYNDSVIPAFLKWARERW